MENRKRRIPHRIFSRESPSPHYYQLLDLYEEMYNKGYYREAGRGGIRNKILKFLAKLLRRNSDKSSLREGVVWKNKDEVFPGKSLVHFANEIRRIVDEFGVKSCLDYGAGQAAYYDLPYTDPQTNTRYSSLKEFLGVDNIATFEPALGGGVGEEKYDLVIAIDVLEHCFVADVPWIVDELFQKANKVVYAHISCASSWGRLPNGQDMHITVRSPEWWRGVFDSISSYHPGKEFEIVLTTTKNRSIDYRYRRTKVETKVDRNTPFVR